MFLGAASQRTKQIRLGHGIMQLTTTHPARCAERIAALDLVVERPGRVRHRRESPASPNCSRFGVAFDEKRAIWEDAIRAIIPMFRDGGVEHHGKYFDMPLRNVLPKPLQKPHPPLMVRLLAARNDRDGRAPRPRRAGLPVPLGRCGARLGARLLQRLHQAAQDKLADYATNPNIALISYFMCAETDEEARRRADGITFFQFALRFYGQSANRERPPPGTVNLWDEYEKWKRANPDLLARALSGGLIGSPETLRRKLRRFETSHIDSVILLNQAGKNTHAHICESLELFAREVMPEFHARIAEQEAWKRQVLAREILLEEIDTQPFRDRYGPNSVRLTSAQAAE